jgi:hypothetical protein
MQGTAGQQAFRIGLAVVGYPGVNFGGKADHIGSDIINENGPADSGAIQVPQKFLGRAAAGGHLIECRPLRLHELQRCRLEHLQGLDMNMAISNHGQFSVLRKTCLPQRTQRHVEENSFFVIPVFGHLHLFVTPSAARDLQLVSPARRPEKTADPSLHSG